MKPLVECVPNFSEGRDESIIRAIGDAAASVDGVRLLHIDAGYDANRTVMTYIAEPSAAVEAGFRAATTAMRLIDMRKQIGVHRRMGAVDVFPIVPFRDISIEACIPHARKLAARLAERDGMPVYLYGKAAAESGRERLPDLRRGGYEKLPEKLKDPAFAPDFGEAAFHPSSGAAVVGVRGFMLAYNVNLDTDDVSKAKQIARRIRESGTVKRDERGKIAREADGTPVRIPGKLHGCQADGWFLPRYGAAQVTMNLHAIEAVGLFEAFQAVRTEAESLGVAVRGSELIGMCPLSALARAGRAFLELSKEPSDADVRKTVAAAVRGLGLDAREPFIADERILESALAAHDERSAAAREMAQYR